MAQEVQIGRVGLDVDLDSPRKVRFSTRPNSRQVTLTFEGIIAASLPELLAIQTELENQVGQLIPFTFTHDATWDGYYVLDSVDIDAEDYAINGTGLLDGSVTMTRKGGEGKVRFQIMSASALMVNNHSILTGDVLFHTAGPVGAYAVNANGVNLINTHTRDTEDGNIQCYIDIDANPTEKPSWAVAPANYYNGGCELKVGNPLRVRAGSDVPSLPAYWELSNKIIRITPGVTAGVNDGRIGIAAWDGTAWDAPVYFQFIYDPAGTPGVNDQWHAFTVVHYTPEKTIIRLERDADEFNPTTYMHRLDIHLRRGDPYFSGRYRYTGGAATWALAVIPTEAAIDVTPTAGPVTGITATAATNGHKWTMVTPTTNTQDNATGQLRWTTVPAFSFGLGFDINAATSAALDDDDSLHIQYLARTEEKERAVRR